MKCGDMPSMDVCTLCGVNVDKEGECPNFKRQDSRCTERKGVPCIILPDEIQGGFRCINCHKWYISNVGY